jgi:predicted membrane-bound spermidine synthase
MATEFEAAVDQGLSVLCAFARESAESIFWQGAIVSIKASGNAVMPLKLWPPRTPDWGFQKRSMNSSG